MNSIIVPNRHFDTRWNSNYINFNCEFDQARDDIRCIITNGSYLLDISIYQQDRTYIWSGSSCAAFILRSLENLLLFLLWGQTSHAQLKYQMIKIAWTATKKFFGVDFEVWPFLANAFFSMTLLYLDFWNEGWPFILW